MNSDFFQTFFRAVSYSEKQSESMPDLFSKKEQIMYASVRRYDGVDSDSVAEIERLVGGEGGFASIISQAPGFIAYYAVDAGDGVVASINLFEQQADAEASNRMAADWIKANLASLLSNPPQTTAGEVLVRKTK
jgi:hypothetical protein